MENIAVSGNHSSQSYGQGNSAPLQKGAVINALVLEKLNDQIYLLKIGNQSIEAKVAAELEEGAEYQFVVKKNSSPPELELTNQDPNQKNANGLTVREENWVNSVLKGVQSDVKSSEVDKLNFFLLLKSFGYSLKDSPEKIAAFIKKVMPHVQSIDNTPPVLRRTLGQTLLFTLNPTQNIPQNEVQNHSIFEQAIKLTGKIPNWSQQDIDLIQNLLKEIKNLPEGQKNQFKEQILNLSTKSDQNTLRQSIESLLSKVNQSLKQPMQQEVLSKASHSILQNDTLRIVLASSIQSKSNDSSFITNLSRSSAIQSYQHQAPGLNTPSVASMLEQFTMLGGKLENLRLGDVLSAQLGWKGNTPSAMEVHRGGTLLYLSQDISNNNKNFNQNQLIDAVKNERGMPVILDKNLQSDPAGSSEALSKLKDFSSNHKLPNSYHIEKFLETWIKNGNPLSEIRAHVDAIQKWNAFIEDFPKFKMQLAEYLMKSPAFSSPLTQSIQSQNQQVAYHAESENLFLNTLKNSGIETHLIPKKQLKTALEIIQNLAGSGNKPTNQLLKTVSWLVAKNMVLSEEMVNSVMSFQNKNTLDLQQLNQQFQQINPDVLPTSIRENFQELFVPLDTKGTLIKHQLNFHQISQMGKFKELAAQFQQLTQGNIAEAPAMTRLATSLLTMSTQSEEYLNGLKQYNIQANRNDTPQLYEVPVSYGDSQEKAWLKIFKRNSGGKRSIDDNYKVVIDLDLEKLGKVRSEVTMIGKSLQLDFLSPNENSLEALKQNSSELSERFKELNLNTALGFKMKNLKNEMDLEEKTTATPQASKSKIDISA